MLVTVLFCARVGLLATHDVSSIDLESCNDRIAPASARQGTAAGVTYGWAQGWALKPPMDTDSEKTPWGNWRSAMGLA